MWTAMTTMAVLGAAEEAKKDVILEMVMTFLASYAGLAGGVSLLVELLKMLWRDWVKPKAPALSIVLTFVLGALAKVLMPDIYGPGNFKSWTLHFVILVFVAVLAAVFHDRFWNVIKGKLGGLIPGGAEEPAPEPTKPPEGGPK
jgi:CDP-diglyceride synthetase